VEEVLPEPGQGNQRPGEMVGGGKHPWGTGLAHIERKAGGPGGLPNDKDADADGGWGTIQSAQWAQTASEKTR